MEEPTDEANVEGLEGRAVLLLLLLLLLLIARLPSLVAIWARRKWGSVRSDWRKEEGGEGGGGGGEEEGKVEAADEAAAMGLRGEVGGVPPVPLLLLLVIVVGVRGRDLEWSCARKDERPVDGLLLLRGL